MRDTRPLPRRYAVAPDGKRFPINTLADESVAATITIVNNWARVLKKWARSDPRRCGSRSAIRCRVKFTRYFEMMRQRSDRSIIKLEWIERVVSNPVKEITQEDGRYRRWAPITEAEGRYLRVVPLSDGETVHNAFFDRSFVP